MKTPHLESSIETPEDIILGAIQAEVEHSNRYVAAKIIEELHKSGYLIVASSHLFDEVLRTSQDKKPRHP